ncbi:MAG: hypothetical protein CFE39_03570 [Comamonadaceae bacterium PBBC2]|nr:MAG: hypothetical protein CFE39_03570 [Comamonadaceae bacterium PBBC2]
MAGLLQVGLQSNWYPEFAASQPIAGLDGTLRDTAAVAGHVRDVHGKDWVVVGFINDDNSKQGRPALDALIEWVARGDGDGLKRFAGFVAVWGCHLAKEERFHSVVQPRIRIRLLRELP